ncbi:MAG TPA: sulfatase-like hydrolase/transferase [Rhizomicrobium sp.]|nr:sulfatase-like hydrolase/transferase [Rhizomicrobium sp.]
MAGMQRPNILVIWGDNIGQSNLSCYTHGLMGYRTPNIDRIARQGMLFTDSYGEFSSTGARSGFITGQVVYRTGLTRIGMPGSSIGMNDSLVTIAALLKSRDYVTGQFGENVLGDLNRMLPTNHGFDEFFGNLYHLNASEGADPDLLQSEKEFPQFQEKFGPRGVIHSWASGQMDTTEMPRWGIVGRQRIKDTGPLDAKRMETCDDEYAAAAIDFIRRAHASAKPWFVWLATTHMHLLTHTKPSSVGQAGRWQSRYHDTMIDHDKNVGQVLDCLDELGIADDTFVQYSTDNGPRRTSWPDAATSPFHGQQSTGWEGAFRVPLLVRWPRRIKPGTICNGIVQHQDWLPTFLAMAGDSDIAAQLSEGYTAIGRRYRNRLDGFNLLPYLAGETDTCPRNYFFYFSDDGDLLAMRFDNMKISFMEQRNREMAELWDESFNELRMPRLRNLRTDPYEFGDSSTHPYAKWFLRNAYFAYVARQVAVEFADSFHEFPPMQRAKCFTLEDAIVKMSKAAAGANH